MPEDEGRRPVTRPDARPNARPDTRRETHPDPRPAARSDSQSESRADPRPAARLASPTESRLQPLPAAGLASRTESRLQPRPDPRAEARSETRPAARHGPDALAAHADADRTGRDHGDGKGRGQVQGEVRSVERSVERIKMPHPKGFLVAIGGNEDKEFGKAVLKRVIGLPEGGTTNVALVATASTVPEQVTKDYQKAFGELGIQAVDAIPVTDREDADRRECVERIREADVVFLSGGDQLRLTSVLGGTRVARAIKDHYWNGGVVAGTSAGAAAMSATMIFEGDPSGGMRKGNVQMTPGLGLIRTAVIDTHFLDRGRLSRLLEVVTSNPGNIGVGLGEDTGIIIRHGEQLEVIGSGVVVLVDGHHQRYTNISQIQIKQAIAVENLIVHTLVEGHGYDLGQRRYLRPPTTAGKGRLP